MGCSWASPPRSQRPFSGVARKVAGIRRLATADRAVPLFTNRRRSVTFSDHAQTLSALRGLHKIAADARPPSGVVSKQVASAALSSRLPVGIGQGASCPQAAAMPPALLGLDRALSSGREPTTRSDAPSGARAHP